MTEPTNLALQRLDEALQEHPTLADHVYRQLLIALHTRNVVSIDSVYDAAQSDGRSGGLFDDPNQVDRARWNEEERLRVQQITRDYVARNFTEGEVDDLVNLTIRREQIHSLEETVNTPNVTFGKIADEIQTFCELPAGETKLAPAEVMSTRVGLIRNLLSDQLEFIGVAKHYVQIRDFDDITRRIMGPDNGIGRIGGKAAGITLANAILKRTKLNVKPFLPIAMPESYMIRSDVIEEFMKLNRLNEYQNQKYKPIDQIAREYPLIKGVFRNGDFPMAIVRSLRDILEELGTHPLIVRSSSLLEDRYGFAFCGKYDSVFVPNQGDEEQRLRALLGAVAEVYASIMAPDPILYRREHNLLDYVEDMAVLIQRVVGTKVGDYFLPAFAGVAFSRNEYRWSPRIKREDGLMRIVMGLGTRAVDRGGSDYPRMVALTEPTLRPESTTGEIRAKAQHMVEVIDLVSNRLRQIPVEELLRQEDPVPHLDKIVSINREGELYEAPGILVDAEPSDMCITFEKLMSATAFPKQVSEMLQVLEKAYGCPVDIEFACDGDNFYLLQCRTQSQRADVGPVTIPSTIPDDRVIFDAHKFVRTALLKDIEYVVYVDPDQYDELESRSERVQVAQMVGKVNHALARKSFILIGPGRWGSNDIRLGVPVRYADINRCAMLIEVARQRGNFTPEVSFGTHFFQDLVEAGIEYLPLFPDEPGHRFNEAFFAESENALPGIVKDSEEFAKVVRVIHVPAVTSRKLTVAMNADTDEALAYLE